jgi:hypothetical protein
VLVSGFCVRRIARHGCDGGHRSCDFKLEPQNHCFGDQFNQLEAVIPLWRNRIDLSSLFG